MKTNLPLALFHGDPWVVLIFPAIAIITTLACGSVLFVLWWRFSKLPPYVPAVVYLSFVALVGALSLVGLPTAVTTVAGLTVLALTLPANLLIVGLLQGSASDSVIEFLMVAVGGLVNAMVIYGLARLVLHVGPGRRSDNP